MMGIGGTGVTLSSSAQVSMSWRSGAAFEHDLLPQSIAQSGVLSCIRGISHVGLWGWVDCPIVDTCVAGVFQNTAVLALRQSTEVTTAAVL